MLRNLCRGDLLQPDFGIIKHRSARQEGKNESDPPGRAALSRCLGMTAIAKTGDLAMIYARGTGEYV